jgi:hypothetical protein
MISRKQAYHVNTWNKAKEEKEEKETPTPNNLKRF